jgi:hypothetical protein
MNLYELGKPHSELYDTLSKWNSSPAGIVFEASMPEYEVIHSQLTARHPEQDPNTPDGTLFAYRESQKKLVGTFFVWYKGRVCPVYCTGGLDLASYKKKIVAGGYWRLDRPPAPGPFMEITLCE